MTFRFVVTYCNDMTHTNFQHETIEFERVFSNVKDATSYIVSCMQVLSRSTTDEIEEIVIARIN